MIRWIASRLAIGRSAILTSTPKLFLRQFDRLEHRTRLNYTVKSHLQARTITHDLMHSLAILSNTILGSNSHLSDLHTSERSTPIERGILATCLAKHPSLIVLFRLFICRLQHALDFLKERSFRLAALQCDNAFETGIALEGYDPERYPVGPSCESLNQVDLVALTVWDGRVMR
jgi:hypothetical protein